jgi:hypothetical protein
MNTRQTRFEHQVYGLLFALVVGGVTAFFGAGCTGTDDAYCFENCGKNGSTGGTGGVAGMGGAGGEGGDGFIVSSSSGGNPCGADLLNDVENCGTCENRCMLASAFPKCVNGMCVVDKCIDGTYDIDLDGKNGCEYTCPVPVLGPELCNGIDDDCDGKVDSDDPDLTPPANLCTTTPGTPCAATTVVCTGSAGWSCMYPPEVEVVSGFVRTTETKCDGLDGNCDGNIDEWFQDLGNECDDGALGKCVDKGVIVCDPMNSGKTICDLTAPPAPQQPTPELCNGADDDCDGFVDEELDPTVFDMDMIPGSNPMVYVDRYEASRPDATMQSAGILETVSCSKSMVLPWTGGSYAEAEAACAARGAGFRLCTAAELSAACNGGMAGMAYPYGMMYDPMACYGVDNPNAMNMAHATGALAMCMAMSGTFDLSGNVTEWTRTQTNVAAAPNRIFQLHGGSYLSPQLGLACTMELPARAAEQTLLPNIGFRCCRQ